MAAFIRYAVSTCQNCSLLKMPLQHVTTQTRLNSNRTAICRINRRLYRRLYPTLLVLPDGSSITVRYHEPRKIIKLPLDIETLSEEEKQKRIKRRSPVTKIEVKEEIEDDFKLDKYSYLWKK